DRTPEGVQRVGREPKREVRLAAPCLLEEVERGRGAEAHTGDHLGEVLAVPVLVDLPAGVVAVDVHRAEGGCGEAPLMLRQLDRLDLRWCRHPQPTGGRGLRGTAARLEGLLPVPQVTPIAFKQERRVGGAGSGRPTWRASRRGRGERVAELSYA